MVEAPIPNPPMNLKNAKVIGSFASAAPTAETKYNTPMAMSMFFLPNLFVGIPPVTAPITVPHKAEAITTKP